MEMFELHLFDSRYHRTTEDDITVLNKDASSLNQNELMEFDENESHRSSITLTKREKSKMIMPLLTSREILFLVTQLTSFWLTLMSGKKR